MPYQAEVVHLYQTALSLTKISKKVGIAWDSVARLLDRAGGRERKIQGGRGYRLRPRWREFGARLGVIVTAWPRSAASRECLVLVRNRRGPPAKGGALIAGVVGASVR